MDTIETFINFVQSYFPSEKVIPLHRPVISETDKALVADALNSTYVSSVGKYVELFENKICEFTGAEAAVAVVNGTAALHTMLHFAGCQRNDYIITQSLTFVATANAVKYCGGEPIFIDIDPETLSLSPSALASFLDEKSYICDDGYCRLKSDNKVIRCCLPMHTFGAIGHISEITTICEKHNINVLEDAAEALGSFQKGKHAGLFGSMGALSFNGNKTITTGGGGAILCKTKDYEKIKHLTTTAKVPHQYEYSHDRLGFNYRLPNLNAALGVGQMYQLQEILNSKKKLAEKYQEIFNGSDYTLFDLNKHCQSNNWLNTIICKDVDARNNFIRIAIKNNILVRPAWNLLSEQKMYLNCHSDGLKFSKIAADLIVNLPSSMNLPD